jgi:hypothetical protein
MPQGPRAEIVFPLPVCENHADPNPDLYVDDAGWLQIATAIKAAGRAEPDRASIQVEFVPYQ